MRIDKPKFESDCPYGCVDETHFENWFETVVEPVNKMLEQGVEVVGHKEADHPYWYMFENPSKESMKSHTHKALLINIQDIKPKTKGERAIESLREVLKDIDILEIEGKMEGFDFTDINSARALLDIRDLKALIERADAGFSIRVEGANQFAARTRFWSKTA